MFTKDEAYRRITELTDRFEDQLSTYKRPDYNETLIRRDYIDPFFKALGWDVDNSQGYFEAYREVIHEDRLTISGKSKAPDYSFRLPGGKKLFFVEAKKPSVMVKNDIQPAYQVRRYGWSAKLPVSIVTDFEEFALYDCTKKPSPTDKAATARLKYFTYKDYHKEFDFFWDTFSKERVLRGGLDKFIISDKIKKGTATVDKEFLLSLDEWRKELALNIALRNELTSDELNFVVQAFLDRLIFLRIAEDRNAEEYASLRNCIVSIGGEKNIVYSRLLELFAEADSKYNSGIFDFKSDKISRRLEIDNVTLRKIIQQLYYPESPYEFSQISVEILGNAYEQFLGKQIILKSARRATIEEKPEVRKAGGVYYTPQYIVDYIVENTLGKLIEGKTPQEVSKLKIVDPACGSGSFLLGAYEKLLKWHLDHYMPAFKTLSAIAGSTEYTIKQRNDAIKERQQLPLTPDGNLTTAVKKQILLNNIYGVDIDLNAVEVTKLSLLLKCMEGETQSSITAELRFGERVLPSLENNIRCGNSLIDVDFYESFPDADAQAVKPFNWKAAFPQVFKQGGFDAVIGNPPYVRQELLGDAKPYFQKKYKVYHGMADLYSYFFEKGIGLLNDKGTFGIIVANKWMRANYGEPLRKWLKQQQIKQIIDFGDLPVFQTATTYPCIILIQKGHQAGIERSDTEIVNVKTLQFENLAHYIHNNKQSLSQTSLEDAGWNLSSDEEQALLKKLQETGIPLGEYVRGKIYRGVLTGLNEAFVIDEATKKSLIKVDKRSAEVIRPFLTGRDVKRYQTPEKGSYVILFPKGFTNIQGSNPKNAWKWLTENYPAIAEHLESFKEAGEKRYDKGEYWWELRACDYYEEFEEPKIIYPNICKQPEFIFDDKHWYTNQKCFIISLNDKYLLGILNSKLNNFLFEKYLPKLRGGFYEPSYVFFKNFPIKKVNENNKKEISLHDEIIKLVDTMLLLNQQLQEATLPHQKEQLQQRIAFTDKKIDALVYELYGLTEEEIQIVEKA